MYAIRSYYAVVVAFGFAWAEIRRFRARKERESTLELVHSYQTPEFADALLQMVSLPDGLSMDELEQHLGAKIKLVAILMTTWESLGLLVYSRITSYNVCYTKLLRGRTAGGEMVKECYRRTSQDS